MQSSYRAIRLALCALLALPVAATAANFTVTVSNFRYSPASVTINVGDTVTFVNAEGFHNVVSDDGAVTEFRCANGCDGAGGNGNLSSGAWSATVAFPTAGTIGYYCEAHGASGGVGMAGRVIVQGTAPPPPPPPFSLSAADQYLWLVPPASNLQQQGFLRLVNRQNSPAPVTVFGLDAAGARSPGTITLTLMPLEARQFNSQDLEQGNPAKGLTGSIGDGAGDWTVVVQSAADIEALTYIRTPDGFLTSMHERVTGNGVDWFVPMFNPAENPNQASRLRIVNTTTGAINVLIAASDDAGASGASQVGLAIPALRAVELTSVDLENGNAAKGLTGALGNGVGKWTLLVSSTGRITVQSLLFDPKGYLTNLSTVPLQAPSGERVLWYVPPASNLQQQGFVRVVNRENRASTMTVWGVDDMGQSSPGTMTFTLAPRAAQQFNSQDMEFGNAAKGLSGSLGDGSGNWRVHLLTDLNVTAMSLIRTPDGFLTSIGDLVGVGTSMVVPMFNPGENPNQVSVLRLVNPGLGPATVTIAGRDDPGVPSTGTASVTLPAGTAIEFNSVELENGNPARGLTGSLGNGSGKWQLSITSTASVRVLSMLFDPRGYLTNLSNAALGTHGKLDP